MKEKENKKMKEKEKENKKKSLQHQKDIFSNEIETSSVASLEGVSLCDLLKNEIWHGGLTSALVPIFRLPADPCITITDPGIPGNAFDILAIDISALTIPDIYISFIDLPSSGPRLSSTSLWLLLSTQSCSTYSLTQESLSPSDSRKAAIF